MPVTFAGVNLGVVTSEMAGMVEFLSPPSELELFAVPKRPTLRSAHLPYREPDPPPVEFGTLT